MPLSGPAAASRKAWLSSSRVVVALELRGEVDDRDGGRRDPQAEAVELALEVGHHEGEGLRGAGRRRDDVLAGGAGPARVLVGDVEDALVVGVRVDRVHQAAPDREPVVHDLGGRREAVRRAARVADDLVLVGVVLPLVDAEDDRDVLALGGGADDDLLRAGVDVGAGLVGVGEDAGRLDHDVDAEVAPRELARVLDLEDLDRLAVDHHRVVGVGHLARVGAVRRVVLEQQGVRRDVDEVVDGDDLDAGRALEQRLERLAADAAETVDTDADGHRRSSLDRDGGRSSDLTAALDMTGTRTAGRARSDLATRTGRGDVGSAAAIASWAMAAATPMPGGVPWSAGRPGDRCSRRPVLDRWFAVPRSSATATRADRAGPRRSGSRGSGRW